MKFVGIDLAWSERNPSGVAVIDADGTLIRATADQRTNEEIVDYAKLANPEYAIVTIDAPLIVKNLDGQRPVERQLTQLFGNYDAGPHSASLKNPAFQAAGRIQSLVRLLEGLGFQQQPTPRKQEPQRVFVEVFPSPAQVILFPCMMHSGHTHCRPPRYKDKPGRTWVETQCEWEMYRARLLSLRAKEPPLKFSPEVKETLNLDSEECTRGRYKQFDDLLDGIFCAYLAYYFWYWGAEWSWVVGDMNSGYVALPRCALPKCRLASAISERSSREDGQDTMESGS